MDNSVIPLLQAGTKLEELAKLSFDELYLFMASNKNYSKGATIGEALELKLAQASLIAECVDSTPMDNELNELENPVNDLAHKQKIAAVAVIVRAYNEENRKETSMEHRAEILNDLKDTLQPLFTNELKNVLQNKPVNKNLLERLFVK